MNRSTPWCNPRYSRHALSCGSVRAVVVPVRPSGDPVIQQERQDIDLTVKGVIVLHLGDTAFLPGGHEPAAEPDQQHTGLAAVEPVQAKLPRLVRVRGPILHRVDVVARLTQLRDDPLPVILEIDVGGGDETLTDMAASCARMDGLSGAA